MRLDRMKAGDFFMKPEDSFEGSVFIRLENCKRHIGAVNAIQINAPGMRCIWGETEVREIKKIKITEG